MCIVATEEHLIVQINGGFDNGTARNVIIFGVDNTSSFHADNCKNNFLVLGESPHYCIIEF